MKFSLGFKAPEFLWKGASEEILADKPSRRGTSRPSHVAAVMFLMCRRAVDASSADCADEELLKMDQREVKGNSNIRL